jgi:hypothetical protein
MKHVFVLFIIYLSLSTDALAHVLFYADEIPEEHVPEQMSRKFPERDRRRPFKSRSAIPEDTPDTGLAYRFQGRSSSSGNISPSEDNPSNQRYYEDKESPTDNANVIPQLFPEEHVPEQMSRRFLQRGRRRPFNSRSAIPEDTPDTELTYRFQGRSSSSGNISPSEDKPSNQRYYKDKQSVTDNVNVIPQLFSRGSESDENYDGSALGPNPEHQILESPRQAKAEASNDEDETEASNYAEEYSPEETNPEIYHQCNSTVPADQDIMAVSEETDPESYHPCNTTVPPVPYKKFDNNFIIQIVSCSAAAVALIIIIIVSLYKLCKKRKTAAHVQYTVHNTRAKVSFPRSKRKLAHSAQMYHYQHQTWKPLAHESSPTSVSENDTDKEEQEDRMLREYLNKFAD